MTLSMLIVGLLAPITSYGEDLDCEPITFSESPDLHNQIEGSDEPEKIPSWLKYRVFVAMFDVYVNEVVQDLAPSDHAILSKLSAETEYWDQAENIRLASVSLELCALSSTIDIVTFTHEYRRISAESNNRAGNRVKRAIGSLSTSGQRIIEEFIKTKVTPELSFPRTDSVDFALREPAGARENMEIMCYTQTHGEPPPEIKKQMECLRQQMGIRSDIESPNRAVAILPEAVKQN